MSRLKTLVFSVKDNVFGEVVSPENLTPALLNEFTEQVVKFLRGSSKVDLSQVKLKIKTGSLAMEVTDESGVCPDVFNDYKKLVNSNDLGKIDPYRARVIGDLQQNTLDSKETGRQYSIHIPGKSKVGGVHIDSTTNFKLKESIWVDEERYMYGRVFDLGGKTKPNVHIELENGKTLKISAKKSLLIQEDDNKLYRKQLVRIKVKRNFETGETKDERLISFENYTDEFNEEMFQAIVKKARIAWRSVQDPVKWVEDIRGSDV